MSIVSRPATREYRNNWPFGPTKFEQELATEELNAWLLAKVDEDCHEGIEREMLIKDGWACPCGTRNVVANPSAETLAKSRCERCGRAYMNTW